jgi:esterase/lipase superfamily enzyme
MRKIGAIALILLLLTGCSTISVRNAYLNWQEKFCRRLPCQAKGDYRVASLFYATNRRAIQKDDKLKFTSDLAGRLTVGTVKTSIRLGLKMERVVPSNLQGRGDVGVSEVTQMSEENFIKILSLAVENSPNQSLLVVVFGYKDNFELTAVKAGYFAYFMDINTPVLLFDWPGDYWGALGGYRQAWDSATASGQQLGELMAKVIRDVKPKNLWLVSSSLGCQVVCNAFEWMAQHGDLADAEAEFTDVVMAAPDVSKDEFDEKFKEQIAALTRQLTVYVASNDSALMMAQFADAEKKLGFQKSQAAQYDKFEEAKNLLYIKSLDPKRVSIIDVTPVNTAGGGHAYYIETPEFYDDLYMRFFEESVLHNRRLYLVNVKEGVDYWVMRSDQK